MFNNKFKTIIFQKLNFANPFDLDMIGYFRTLLEDKNGEIIKECLMVKPNFFLKIYLCVSIMINIKF